MLASGTRRGPPGPPGRSRPHTPTEVAAVLADESAVDTIAENASTRGEIAFNEFKILREMSGPTDTVN